MPTHFTVFERENDIIISPIPGFEISDKQQDFILDIEKTQIVIKELYKPDKNILYTKYFNQLLKLAQVGLVGDAPNLDLALKAIQQLKSDIVRRESTDIKNKYLKNLGNITINYTLFFIILSVIVKLLFYFKESPNLEYLMNFSVLISGSTIGVWLSATISKTKLEFDDLINMETNQLLPNVKMIFTILLTTMFGLLFIKEAIVIEIGPISTKDFLNDTIIAMIFGVVLGLNERFLGKTFINSSSGFFNSIGT